MAVPDLILTIVAFPLGFALGFSMAVWLDWIERGDYNSPVDRREAQAPGGRERMGPVGVAIYAVCTVALVLLVVLTVTLMVWLIVGMWHQIVGWL